MESTKVSGPSILVVEDDQTILKMIEAALTKVGYAVAPAQNGSDALDFALSTPPELVLTDVVMPEMDGFELCQKLKRLSATSAIPVLILTALDDIKSVFKGFQKGADGYILKPFKVQEVLERIDELLVAAKKNQQQQVKPEKDVEEMSLVEILRLCAQEHLTGAIRLTRLGQDDRIILQGGEITGVNLTNQPDEQFLQDILQWKWKEGNFYVEQEEDAELQEEQQEPVNVSDTEKPSILFVNQDSTFLKHFSGLLRARYTLSTVNNGKEGLECIQKHQERLDIVIVDLSSAGMEELDFLVQAKQLHPTLQPIILTSSISEEACSRASKRSHLCYLHKPVKGRQLTECIDLAVKIRRSLISRGEVNALNLVDIVQLYCIGQVLAALTITRVHEGKPEKGIVYFEGGQIHHVIFNKLPPEKAFFHLVDWKYGDFTTTYGVGSGKRTIHQSWEELLEDIPDIQEKVQPVTQQHSNLATGKEVKGMASKTQQLQEVLKDIQTELTEAETIAIVATDGTVFATNASGTDANRVGAMVATFVGMSKKACQTLKKGEPTEGLIKGETGYIAIYPAGKKADLGVTTKSSANLAMLNMVCRDAAEKIQKVLG